MTTDIIVKRWKDRALAAERQLAATVDELTAAQTNNERLSGYLVDAFEQRDAAQAAREQAEAQRDRALEQLAAEQAAHEHTAEVLARVERERAW